MEFLFELIIDLVFELGIEASKSARVPKLVRVILLVLFVLFALAVFCLILFVGVSVLKDTILGGVVIILLGLLLFAAAAVKFRKTYFKNRRVN